MVKVNNSFRVNRNKFHIYGLWYFHIHGTKLIISLVFEFLIPLAEKEILLNVMIKKFWC
jgi:hypothetical protein